LLVVETDDGKSSKDEGGAGLGFSLLSDTEAQQVRADEAKIRNLNLSEPANTFAIAQVYASHELYAEAIQMLEKLAADHKQTANVYRTLGDLYQQVGLITMAESRYINALDSAGSTNDLESLAAIEKGLGEAYTALGNKDQAVHWLTEAKAGYEKLGDGQLVKAIGEELQMLTP
jgi:tetratricopeptide (TPR) repeat protein